MAGRLTKEESFRRNLLTAVEKVANGATLSEIGRQMGVDPSEIRRAIINDPELNEKWEVAKSLKAHALFDQMVDLSRQLSTTKWGSSQNAQVAAIRTAIDTLKHAAARLNPQDYGERQSVHQVVPIAIYTTLDLGQKGAPAKSATPEEGYIITVEREK